MVERDTSWSPNPLLFYEPFVFVKAVKENNFKFITPFSIFKGKPEIHDTGFNPIPPDK